MILLAVSASVAGTSVVSSVADPPPIIERLRRSELIGEEHITALVTSGLDLLKPEDLANELVKRDLLTKFQADQILSNRLEKLELGPYRLLRPIGSRSEEHTSELQSLRH